MNKEQEELVFGIRNSLEESEVTSMFVVCVTDEEDNTTTTLAGYNISPRDEMNVLTALVEKLASDHETSAVEVLRQAMTIILSKGGEEDENN